MPQAHEQETLLQLNPELQLRVPNLKMQSFSKLQTIYFLQKSESGLRSSNHQVVLLLNIYPKTH